MAKCKLCDRKGFFLSVDSDGLCKDCAYALNIDVTQRGRILNESIELARKGKTFSTRLSRCDLLLEHARCLLKYEGMNIQTISPTPSEILVEYGDYRDKLIIEEACKVADKGKAKAEVAATIASKYNALANSLIKVKDIFKNLSNPTFGKKVEKELKFLIHKIKLDGFLDAAKKAEFKGNKKRAIDQYQEALYFIRNDDIPDDQQIKEIKEIESKLKELE